VPFRNHRVSDADSDHTPYKRPWLAVVLTLLVPGLGHLYIEYWKRSFLWFVLSLGSTELLLPDDWLPSEFTVDAFVQASESVPFWTLSIVTAIYIACLVDTYVLSLHVNEQVRREVGDVQSCPNCGRELDDDIDFCHWCTTRLDQPGES
jgi:hypothetical protein